MSHKIIQTWRSIEFSEEDEDFVVTIELVKTGNDTLLTLTHINIPKCQGECYEKGEEYCFIPMQSFFEE